MAEIAGQAVGNVDRAAGDADAAPGRGRPAAPAPPSPGAPARRRRRRSASVPRNTSSARRASPSVPLTQRSSPARAPERSSAAPVATSPKTVIAIVSGPRVVSPPTSSQSWRSASASRPRANGARKASSARGQGQRQREGERPGAAGGQVAQVDRQRLVPEPLGGDGREEVPALDQHVARDRERACPAPRASSAQSSPTPSAARRTGSREVAGDEFELAEQGHGAWIIGAGPAPDGPRRPGKNRGRRPAKRCNDGRLRPCRDLLGRIRRANHAHHRTTRRRAAPSRPRLSRVSDARQGRDRRDQAARQPARPRARLFARRRRGLRGDRRRPGQRLPLHRARQPRRRHHQRHRGARPGRHRPARRQAGDGRQGRPVQEVRRHRRLRHRGQREEPRQADRRDRRARADLRRHQPRGHQGAGLLLRRAGAALADEDPGLPRRPARHGDRRRRRAC